MAKSLEVSKQGSSLEDLFKGRQFEGEIIIHCVRWYLRYKLSYRDLVEMMAERGVAIAPVSESTTLTSYGSAARAGEIALPIKSTAHAWTMSLRI